MKKGQGQLIAFVLLIGLTVVLGIMVGNWMIKQSRKMGESAIERHEIDAKCSDTSIVVSCAGGYYKIINKGLFKIKLKAGNQPIGGDEWIMPGQSSQLLNMQTTILPFVEIEGKEFGCHTKEQTIDENTCPS